MSASYEWTAERVVLGPGPAGGFDETAVKDPSVVRFEGRWHVFYTARGRGRYTMGYVAAEEWSDLAEAPRHSLEALTGTYGCAPQVFRFEPHGLWYLVFQTDAYGCYAPVYSTNAALDDPSRWTSPQPLLERDEPNKWIDFWTICDGTHGYLFYTRDHDEIMVRCTALDQFPGGWGQAEVAFTGVHESVHVYRVRGREAYHLFYEERSEMRSFGLACANSLSGPWTSVTDAYATPENLRSPWTDIASHGEPLRSGFDQRLEYDAERPVWLIQGLKREAYVEPYPEMGWRLGLMERRG